MKEIKKSVKEMTIEALKKKQPNITPQLKAVYYFTIGLCISYTFSQLFLMNKIKKKDKETKDDLLRLKELIKHESENHSV